MQEAGTEVSTQERVAQSAEPVVDAASNVADKGRGAFLTNQIGTRSSQLANQLTEAAQTLRGTADQARQDGNDQHARVATQVADRAERLGGYLGEVDPDELVSDIEQYARREPWVVAGVGLLVGFMVARSVKASSGRRYQARSASARGSSERLPLRHGDRGDRGSQRSADIIYADPGFE